MKYSIFVHEAPTADGTVDTPVKRKTKASAHRFRQLGWHNVQLKCCYLALADLADRNIDLAAYFYPCAFLYSSSHPLWFRGAFSFFHHTLDSQFILLFYLLIANINRDWLSNDLLHLIDYFPIFLHILVDRLFSSDPLLLPYIRLLLSSSSLLHSAGKLLLKKSVSLIPWKFY